MNAVMNIEPLEKRLEGFNLRVFRVDGHNAEVLAALGRLQSDGRPTVILCDTNSSQGLPVLQQRAPKFHYVRFTQEAEREAYREVLAQMKRSVIKSDEAGSDERRLERGSERRDG